MLSQGNPRNVAFGNKAVYRDISAIVGNGQKQFLAMGDFLQDGLRPMYKPTNVYVLVASVKEENLSKPNSHL